jgi:hypothetical protein
VQALHKPVTTFGAASNSPTAPTTRWTAISCPLEIRSRLRFDGIDVENTPKPLLVAGLRPAAELLIQEKTRLESRAFSDP